MTSSIKPVRETQANLSEEKAMLSNELEEILCEMFYVLPEEGTYEYFEARSIYDLSDEKEAEFRRKLDLEKLMDGEPDVEDLEMLEIRARAYFENPEKVYIPVELDEKPYVTGYVQVMDGVRFIENGDVDIKWKSIGLKIKVEIDCLYNPECIASEAMKLGVELNDFTRVVFYGNPLREIVGDRIYRDGEKKELLELCPEFENIVVAIPDYEECCRDELSIYETIDNLLKEDIPYGSDLDICNVTLGHYWMTKQRLEELKEEAEEEFNLVQIGSKEEIRSQKVNAFNANFEDARRLIGELNNQNLKVSDLSGKSVKLIAQVLYLAEKQGERIENKFTYLGLKSLLKKLKIEEAIDISSASRLDKIDRINKGEVIEVHLMNYEELAELMNLLWSGAARIDLKYKDVYLALKERYNHLKRVKESKAA